MQMEAAHRRARSDGTAALFAQPPDKNLDSTLSKDDSLAPRFLPVLPGMASQVQMCASPWELDSADRKWSLP